MNTSTNFQDYRLRYTDESPVLGFKRLTLGSLVFDDFGEEVLARLKEQFEGVSKTPLAYSLMKHEKREPVPFSNLPGVLAINEIVRGMTQGRIVVLNPIETVKYLTIVKYWGTESGESVGYMGHCPGKYDTLADTDSVAIYPKPGPNEKLRLRALAIIGREPKDLEVPLIISGLGVRKDTSTEDGFTFKETDYMQSMEAPFLEQDGTLRYDKKEESIFASDEGINVWTPSHQSGLSRIIRNRAGHLDAHEFNLWQSPLGVGRIDLLEYPKDTPITLESIMAFFRGKR